MMSTRIQQNIVLSVVLSFLPWSTACSSDKDCEPKTNQEVPAENVPKTAQDTKNKETPTGTKTEPAVKVPGETPAVTGSTTTEQSHPVGTGIPPVSTGENPKPAVVLPKKLTRNDPPPRAAFAAEDVALLEPLYYPSSPRMNLPVAFQKIAEIFQFDKFRAVPVAPEVPQPDQHKVLLLSFNSHHLEETLNVFAGLAVDMQSRRLEATQGPDWKLKSVHSLPIASREPTDIPGAQFGKIVIHIPTAQAGYIKEIPLSAQVQAFWPEAMQLEFAFGENKIVFIFSTVITLKNKVVDLDVFSGKVLLQTPWILRALEGEPLKALWQAVSGNQVDTANMQWTDSEQKLEERLQPNLFESLWDARSSFFPKNYAFRVVNRFGKAVSCGLPGTTYFGYTSLRFPTVTGFRDTIKALVQTPGFILKNTLEEK